MRGRRPFLAVMLCLAATSTIGATIRGVVTGDVDHLPWRKGKRELGWCTVKLFRDHHLEAVTRTNAGTGEFTIQDVAPGEVEVLVSRPGFRARWLKLDAGEPSKPLRVHLDVNRDYGVIVAPRTGTATTVVPGSTLAIEVAAPPEAHSWEVSLTSDHWRKTLSIADAGYGARAAWNDTRPGWRLAVPIPDDTPGGLYALFVHFAEGEGRFHSSCQHAAVHVLDSYPDRFRLMPYCDFHLDWHVNRPGEAGEVQKRFFEAASLLNPLFVSLGDDIGFETDDAVAMFHHLAANYCTVPVYLAFGNHDAGIGIEGFEYYFGPRWQTRRIGPHIGLVLSYDLYQANYAMPQDQRDGVNAALSRLHADPAVKLIFLAGHLNAWKPPTPFFQLPFTEQTRTSFLGHSDGRVEVEFQRLFLHALSVGSMHGWGGLNYTGRVVEFDDWKRAILLPQCALPTVAFDRPNDGTATTNTATIRLTGLPAEQWTPPEKLYTGGYFCDLPKEWKGLPSIRDARLRFVMPKGRYRASAGRILQQVDSARDGATVVVVAVDVTEPVTTVTLSPVTPR